MSRGAPEISLAAAELSRLAELRLEALVCSVFEDERPLRGLTGLLDWRLAGRLSRLFLQERATGKAGETVLLPPGRKLAVPRLLLFGLGPSTEFGPEPFARAVRRLRVVLAGMGVSRYGLTLPGCSLGRVPLKRALALAVEEWDEDGLGGEIVLFESPALHRELAEVIKRGRE